MADDNRRVCGSAPSVNAGAGATVEPFMHPIRSIFLAGVVLFLGACAVNTRVIELNPAHRFPPTQSVEILLQKPDRPYVEIALLEASGTSEIELLEDAREKAKALGADAIVRDEIHRVYHPPVAVHDPWYDPFYYGYRRIRPYPFYGSPWGPYRVVGGGYSYVLKALAIKYGGPPPAQ